jgi:8-amino-7-oxononanoate synthase
MADSYFQKQLALIREQALYRELRPIPPEAAAACLNFSSNDYLGLANDVRLKAAAITAINTYGSGATASRLLAGNLPIFEELEAALARMMGSDTALVFGSGFLTNLGVFSSVAEADDQVFSDWLNHASIIDGIRLSPAHRTRYRHKDLDHLESLLKTSSPKGKKIIVSESLFSMDGDIAPVADLKELADRYGALLVIDEAHAVGVMGQGGGVCRARGVRPDITVGTLSKALGGYGGFVACSAAVREFLVNKARSFIYSTGLPPSCIASASAAVDIIRSSADIGDRLLDKARRFREKLVALGYSLPAFESQILHVPIGSNEKALEFSGLLMEKGLFVRAIRPPTVPAGTARVRLSITLAMTDEALNAAAGTMAASARKVGIIS